MSRLSCLLLVITAFVAACSDTAGPVDDYQLPAPDTSLDPGALRIGDIWYACGDWVGTPPADTLILVDLFFGQRSAADPMDRPRSENLDSVRALGGRVLFEFAFPAARVRIPSGSVPRLAASGVINYARAVPDARRYDWDFIVWFTRARQPSDSAVFVALGGRVSYLFLGLPAVAGALPNSAAVIYRRMPDVEFVSADGMGCTTGAPLSMEPPDMRSPRPGARAAGGPYAARRDWMEKSGHGAPR